MKIKTLSNLKSGQIPRDNQGYGFIKVSYRGLLIHIWKSSNDGTYAYRSYGGAISGTHYPSLSHMKNDIKEEVDELERKANAYLNEKRAQNL